MPWRDRLPFACVATLLLAGCASTALDDAPPRADAPWRPATDADGAIVPGRSSPAAAQSAATWVLPPNAALAGVPAPPPLAADHAYTLPELIDIAQSSHPETRIAWEQARRAALATGVVQSAYLPHVSASVIGGHRRSDGSGSTLGVGVDRDDSATGTVSALVLEWLLFDFGGRDAVMEATQQTSIASNIAFTAAHQRVIHEVCLAYYGHAAAQAHVRSAAEALKNTQEVEAAAQDRFRRGVGTVVEATQAAQATAQAQLARVRAAGGARDAYQALVTAMGVSPLTRFEVAEIPARTLSAETARSVDHIVADALSRRPDMLAAHAMEKASAAAVRAAEADFKPRIFIAGTGAYTSGRLGLTSIPSVGQLPPTLNLSGNGWNSTVLLGLSIPLYDAGLRDSRRKQAQADADRAVAVTESVRNEAVRQVVAAQNAVETSLAAHEATKAVEVAARTSYDAAFDAWRQGVGTITAVNVAATQLLQATDAATDTYSGALAAAATLAFATGSLGSAP